ncbi:hypothetical protein [Nonomuraea antimicrobica]|uniref:hypothetical protein n=1 Tax=Nonomuraea antimicrobica TaxID=561173 RepID=UPI0031EA952A
MGTEIQFKDGKIKNAGDDMGEQAPAMNTMAQNTGGIRVESPAFGIIGIGLNYAHDKVKDDAHNTLKQARDSLASYRTAMRKLEASYQKADHDNDGIINAADPGAGGLGGGGLGDGGLGAGGLGGDLGSGVTPADFGSVPDPGDVPGAGDLPGAGDVPSSDLPDSKLPEQPDVPDMPDQPDATLPEQPDMPDTNLPDPNIPDPNASVPSIEDQINQQVPAVDPNALNPNQSDLASFDPSNLGNIPIGPSGTTPPGGTTSVGPGMGGGMPTGGGSSPGVQPAAAASGLRGGMNGMSGMPFMPMSGGGTGAEEKEREKPEYVRGDEDDWMDDIDIAPPVIGE